MALRKRGLFHIHRRDCHKSVIRKSQNVSDEEKTFDYQIKILSASDKQCQAVIPIKLTITYADGRTADIQEYAVTDSKGILNGKFAVPLNAPAGTLTISVSTLPGKISGTAKVTIN